MSEKNGKNKKVTMDMSMELYDEVMQVAGKLKVYKFGPSVLYLIRYALDNLEKENK